MNLNSTPADISDQTTQTSSCRSSEQNLANLSSEGPSQHSMILIMQFARTYTSDMRENSFLGYCKN